MPDLKDKVGGSIVPGANLRWGYLLLIAAGSLHFPSAFYRPIREGIDGTWQIALHTAFLKGSIFGQDFVFTYGPLGVLYTRLGFPGIQPWLLAYDLVWLALLCSALVLLTRRLSGVFSLAMAALCIGVSAAVPFSTNQIFHVAVLFLFFLFHAERENCYKSYLLALGLALFLFFTQLHVGLLVGLFFLLQQCTNLCSGKRRLRSFLLAISYFPLVLILGGLLQTDILGYLQGGLEIVSCYQAALSLGTPQTWHVYAIVLVLLCFANAAFSLLRTASSVQARVQLLMIGAFLLLAYKQSIVRSDFYHLPLFLVIAPLALGVLYLFTDPQRRAQLGVVILIALVCSLGVARHSLNSDSIANRLAGFTQYPLDIFSSTEFQQSAVGTANAPDVDVLPWRTRKSDVTQLKYAPRPIPTSYAVCTTVLDRINANYFYSAKAPEQVVFRPHCIDDEYCFMSESRTKIALANRYQLTVATPEKLVLTRTARSPIYQTRNRGSFQMNLGEWYTLEKSDELHFASFMAEYSLLGQLTALAYKPAPIRISFRLKDRSIKTFPTAPSLLQNGVLLNRYVQSTSDAEKFFRPQIGDLRRVEAIRLSSPQPWQIQSTIEVVRYSLGS